MGLINNTEVNTSIGVPISGTFCDVKFDTTQMLSPGGIVRCGLNWYSSEESFDNGGGNIYPLDSDGNIVSDKVIIIQTSDVVKAGANCTVVDVAIFFFTKIATKLTQDYGWDITITQ